MVCNDYEDYSPWQGVRRLLRLAVPFVDMMVYFKKRNLRGKTEQINTAGQNLQQIRDFVVSKQ